MKRIIFLACSLAQATLSPAQDVIGDMNADKKLDAADVAQLVSYLTGKATQKKYVHEVEAYIDADGAFKGKESTAHLCGDMNDDNELTKDDVDLLINTIIGKTEKKTFYSAERYLESDGRVSGKYTIGNKEYTLAYSIDCVDFDLPSGLLWAKENVKVGKKPQDYGKHPEDYGDYFAWGEVEPKDSYTLSNYKYYKNKAYTKYYYIDEEDDDYDGEVEVYCLTNDDDIVHNNMGGDWQLPTIDNISYNKVNDFTELRQHTYWLWTSNYMGTSKSGFIVYKPKIESDANIGIGYTPHKTYSLSDTHIFLPATGYIKDQANNENGTCGRYWSINLSNGGEAYANSWYFDSGKTSVNLSYKYYGITARGVCPKK